MKPNYTITSKVTPVKNGLVDFIADGYINRDGERIPCKIGFTEFSDEPEVTHIFIKDGITENGTHYDAETIEL